MWVSASANHQQQRTLLEIIKKDQGFAQSREDIKPDSVKSG